MRALAPEVRFLSFLARSRLEKGAKAVPQWLKPCIAEKFYGTAEPVPFVQNIFPQPYSAQTLGAASLITVVCLTLRRLGVTFTGAFRAVGGANRECRNVL
jgi:hypothetical protein